MELDAFLADRAGLDHAVKRLVDRPASPVVPPDLPSDLPEEGIGAIEALDSLAPRVLDHSRDLAAPGFLAHMDPPTPWVTWATTMWTASRNQNLLHPDTAPQARAIEARVVDWLAPRYGQSGGHLCPGSTIANLTALWAAREAGARNVVAGPGAHVSIAKAAHLLGLPRRVVDEWADPGDVRDSVAVVTAGTTSTGEIESLDALPEARWRHLDAAWAGPLRLSDRHRHLLDGVEGFDSVAISAHKWLFQPKESALVLFRDHLAAHRSISVDGAYLAAPNVGVLGSHGATAVPLLATLLAYGRSGIAAMIDRSMALAGQLHALVEADADLVARSAPHTGILCWNHRSVTATDVVRHLPPEVFVSTTVVDSTRWLRSVAANPLADPELIVAGVKEAAVLAKRPSHPG